MFIWDSDVSNARISSTINGMKKEKNNYGNYGAFQKWTKFFNYLQNKTQMKNLTYCLEVALLPLALNSHQDEDLCHY